MARCPVAKSTSFSTILAVSFFHSYIKFSQDFNIMALIDSLATRNPIGLHNIPDVKQNISMTLNFELVVQPLFAFGESGDFQCIGCPFVSVSYVTMFYHV
jgi:hypothetical protein